MEDLTVPDYVVIKHPRRGGKVFTTKFFSSLLSLSVAGSSQKERLVLRREEGGERERVERGFKKVEICNIQDRWPVI
jgi:hypothetical protein